MLPAIHKQFSFLIGLNEVGRHSLYFSVYIFIILYVSKSFELRAVPGKRVRGLGGQNLKMGVPPTPFYLFFL